MTSGLLSGDASHELEALKDQLFIKTGEDLVDTFMAFEKYGMNQKLSSQDRDNIDEEIRNGENQV